MNLYLKVIIISILCFNNFCLGQNELSGFHLESRNKADFLIDELIEEGHFDLSPYALLASNNTYYLIILDRGTHYSMAWVELEKNGNIKVDKVKNIKTSNSILKKVFDFKDYHKDFISFDSEFYKNGYELASGATTYFVVKDKNGIRYGESVLSMLVSPNPIDKKIYGFMATELINSSE